MTAGGLDMNNGLTLQAVISYTLATFLAGSKYVHEMKIKQLPTGYIVEANYKNIKQGVLVNTLMNIELTQSGYVEIGYTTQVCNTSTSTVLSQVHHQNIDAQFVYPPVTFQFGKAYKKALESYEYAYAVNNLKQKIKEVVESQTAPYYTNNNNTQHRKLRLWGTAVMRLFNQVGSNLAELFISKDTNMVGIQYIDGTIDTFSYTEIDGVGTIINYRTNAVARLTESERQSLSAPVLMGVILEH